MSTYNSTEGITPVHRYLFAVNSQPVSSRSQTVVCSVSPSQTVSRVVAVVEVVFRTINI